jgi:hypothetical protein
VATKFCTVASNTGIVSCHSSGAWNFEVATRFLENMCTPLLMNVSQRGKYIHPTTTWSFKLYFSFAFSDETWYAFWYMLHDPYTLFYFIQSPYQYVVQYTVDRAPCNAVFSILLWISLRCSAHFFSSLLWYVECIFFPYLERQTSHPHRPGGSTIILCIWVFTFSRDRVLSQCGPALQILTVPVRFVTHRELWRLARVC